MILYKNEESQRNEEDKLIRFVGMKLLEERKVMRKNDTELNLSKLYVKQLSTQCYFCTIPRIRRRGCDRVACHTGAGKLALATTSIK